MALPFALAVLVTSVAGQFLSWSDSTGASSSEGNVITCTWGVLCRHGFKRSGPDETCDSSFECSPAGAVMGEPAQVPQGPPPLGPGLEPAGVPPAEPASWAPPLEPAQQPLFPPAPLGAPLQPAGHPPRFPPGPMGPFGHSQTPPTEPAPAIAPAVSPNAGDAGAESHPAKPPAKPEGANTESDHPTEPKPPRIPMPLANGSSASAPHTVPPVKPEVSNGESDHPTAPKPPKIPTALGNGSNASAPHVVPPVKPEVANATVPQMPNASGSSDASGLTSNSSDSNKSPGRLRGSVGKGGTAQTDGPRRLDAVSHGHKITCRCGVVCPSGSRLMGERICRGPLQCETCGTPTPMGGRGV